jgi:glycosyltransferase involved in cell wall biosynthesis
MSLVSVIMPTYNAEKWVTDAIDNLKAQTWRNLELIIVDDASSDTTVAVARKKLEKDFDRAWKIIEVERNGGPSAARNLGVKSAAGEWLQFLDSDDLLAPEKLSLQMAVCENASPDLVAVYSPWRVFFLDDGKITWAAPLADTDMTGKKPIMCLAGADRYLHNAGLVRRSTYEKIGGFDERLRFWECEEINVRIAKAGRLERVRSKEPLYLWRLYRDKSYLGGDKARYKMAPVALSWIELFWEGGEHKTLTELDLLPQDRREILVGCTMWLRRLYPVDRPAFRQFLAMMRKLEPGFRPATPAYAAFLSRFMGYEAAEAVAQLGGLPRRLARKTLRMLGRHSNTMLD